MVIFSELALSEDGSRLSVECSVRDLSIYDGMYIKSIAVEYYANAQVSGEPSEKAIRIFDNAGADNTVKYVRTYLDASDARVKKMFELSTFSGGLFYIIVECDGELGAAVAGLPCGYDETRDTGVILDWFLLYRIGMNYIAEMNCKCHSECRNLSGFDGFVILWHSIRVASESKDLTMLKTLWKKFLRVVWTVRKNISSNCGCGK